MNFFRTQMFFRKSDGFPCDFSYWSASGSHKVQVSSPCELKRTTICDLDSDALSFSAWSLNSPVTWWHHPTRPAKDPLPASDLVATSSQSILKARAKLVEPLTEAQEHRHASLRATNQRDDLWRLRGLGPAETWGAFWDRQLWSEFCNRISTNPKS